MRFRLMYVFSGEGLVVIENPEAVRRAKKLISIAFPMEISYCSP